MARQSGKITRKSGKMVGNLGKRPGKSGKFWNPGKRLEIHENGWEIEEMVWKSGKTGKMAGSVSICVCSVCVRNVGNSTHSEHFLEALSNRVLSVIFVSSVCIFERVY